MNLTNKLAVAIHRLWLPVALLSVTALLGACGGKKDGGEVAAKVNKTEITTQQIDFVLQQQRNLRADLAEAARPQILERLIDQNLVVKKAEELKLDKVALVMQHMETARREILARAYAEKAGEAAVKPTAEDVKKYYDSKPELFSERQIFNIQEIAIEATAEQAQGLRDKLAGAKSINEFVEFLKESGLRFSGNQAVRSAEQMSFGMLDAIGKLKPGQAMLMPSTSGMQLVVLAGSRMQPLTEEQARPAIEQFILNDRKRKLADADMKALRAAAKIEYLGKFTAPVAGAASAPAPAASK